MPIADGSFLLFQGDHNALLGFLVNAGHCTTGYSYCQLFCIALANTAGGDRRACSIGPGCEYHLRLRANIDCPLLVVMLSLVLHGLVKPYLI